MHWLELPPPHSKIAPALSNPENARAWLAGQPQADPLQMQSILLQQIEALDGCAMPALEKLPLLNILKSTTIGVQASLEPRYLRKPLPLSAGDQEIFEKAHQLWTSLGIAYLRISPQFAPPDRLLPLHQAGLSIRLAEYCYLQAAQECPALLDRLLFSILEQAVQAKLERLPVADPDFRHLGESNIAGHIAWAFLLRLIAPYRLSAHQLAVANRALGRWRELSTFQQVPDTHPKAQAIALDKLYGAPLPEGRQCYLDVRPILRKIRNRIESLHAGESPESLKLGRELSGTACVRLLQEMQSSLSQHNEMPLTEAGELALVFGVENAYTLFSGKPLNAQSLDSKSTAISHQRLALFGFDRVSQVPNAVPRLNLPSEAWHWADGLAVRPIDAGERHLSPCLVATVNEQGPRLGVLLGLRVGRDASLRAQPSWYPELPGTGIIKHSGSGQPNIPVFTLIRGDKTYLIAPSNAGIKLDTRLSLAESSLTQLIPIEVSERGTDFVRYLCRRY